jgi:hypothetical protein
MFTKATIQTAAAGLIGLNTSIHLFYKYLTASFKLSSSKYWINALQGADFSTIEAMNPSRVQNIDLVVGERYEIRATGGTFTNVGAADNAIGTAFTASGTTPTAWSTAWLELQSCNQYIADIYNEEVTNLVTKFINNAKAYLRQNTLLANHAVIGGVADMANTVTKNSRFVGFVLTPHEGNNVVNIITKLGFLGDAADSGLKLYLYETSQDDAIATYEFDYTTALSQQWAEVTDFIIKYDNSTAGGIGQRYLLGYFEDDLTCNAIEMEFNQSLKNFSVFGKYMSCFPVAIPSANLDGYNLPTKMLDLGNYITENTHGLYFKFTAKCDYTNLIKDNITMFAEPLQYAIAIRILEDAIASVGDGVHNSTKDAGIIEWRKLVAKYSGILNGGYISVGGDQSVYKKGLIELLTLDFSNVDPVCFHDDWRHEWRIGNLI